MPETLSAAPLRQALEEWLASGGLLDAHLSAIDARYCRRLLAREMHACAFDAAERVLIAIGAEWRMGELYPPPPHQKRSGLWSNPHPLRKLNERQVLAAHRLHIDGGLSLREIGRQLHARLGYSSPHSCAQALSDAFRRSGLPRRDRIAATVAASTTHGRGARSDSAAYKRWHRETFGPWPSDHRRRDAA